MECPGLNIHRYHEDLDLTICYPLNPRLIEELQKRGWFIKDKLAEGSSADVFNLSNIKSVLIIQSNSEIDDKHIYELVDMAEDYRHIFPHIYDYFNLDIPYSSDPDYIDSTGNFGDKTIQVMEKMDMTLDQYLIELKNEKPHLLNDAIQIIINKLFNFLTELHQNGLTYTDLKLENIGISGSNIRLLDIEGLQIDYDYPFDPKDTVERLYKYEIYPLIS